MLACAHPAFDGPVILFQNIIKVLHRSMSAVLLQSTLRFELPGGVALKIIDTWSTGIRLQILESGDDAKLRDDQQIVHMATDVEWNCHGNAPVNVLENPLSAAFTTRCNSSSADNSTCQSRRYWQA
jgi:hypothetical protein